MLEVDVVFALFCLLLLLLFPWGFGVLSWPDPILPNKSSSQVSSNSSLWYLISLLQALRWKTVDPDWSALHDFSILNNSSDDVSLIGGQNVLQAYQITSLAEILGTFHSKNNPVWNFGNSICPVEGYIPVAQSRSKPPHIWILCV